MNNANLMKNALDDLYHRLDRYSDKEPRQDAKKYFVDSCISLGLLYEIYGDRFELNDRLALVQAYTDVSDALDRWDYSRFFYGLTKIFSEGAPLEWKLREGQFDCLSMASILKAYIHKASWVNSSLLDSFLMRAPSFVSSCFKVLNDEKYDDSIKRLSIYGILSALSAYINYIQSDFQFSYLESQENPNPRLRDNVKAHIVGWIGGIKQIILESNGQEPYVNYGKVLFHEAHEIGLFSDSIDLDIQVRDNLDMDLWSAINILRFSKSIPTDLANSIGNKLDGNLPWNIKPRIPLALCIINDKVEKFEFNLTPKVGNIDVNEVMDYILPSLKKITVDGDFERDRKEVDTWDDDKLQCVICEIINESPSLSDDERREVNRESKKKDSGYEIADIAFPIKIGEKNIMVCIPLKTGREIGGPLTKSLSEDKVTHQILRPFQNYGEKTFLLLITVRRCSQPLTTIIQKAKTQWNWPIVRIEGDDLISLLKYHSKITS